MRIRVSSHFPGRKRIRRGFYDLQQLAPVKDLEGRCGIPTTPTSGEAAPSIFSPGIRYLGGLLYSAPVGVEVVLGGRELAISGERPRHGGSICLARTEGREEPRAMSS